MKKRIVVETSGALKEALEEVHGELEGRKDVLERLNPAEVGRRLMAYAIREHQAGRGPWPKHR